MYKNSRSPIIGRVSDLGALVVEMGYHSSIAALAKNRTSNRTARTYANHPSSLDAKTAMKPSPPPNRAVITYFITYLSLGYSITKKSVTQYPRKIIKSSELEDNIELYACQYVSPRGIEPRSRD